MPTAFMEQTFLPAASGLTLFTLVLVHKFVWAYRQVAAQLFFLALQIALIHFTGLMDWRGSALIVGLLAGFAGTLAWQERQQKGFSILPAAFFVGFVLVWFQQKYLSGLTLSTHLKPFAIVGISYIGFKFIHFVVDYRAGAIKNFQPIEFVTWLLFFPSIIAGPMQRFQDWQEQRQQWNVNLDSVQQGIWRLLQGVALKFVLADSVHNATLPSMSEGTVAVAQWSELIWGALLYTLYLYWDFAGYCSIAIGIAYFWGIRLPENFNYPFMARNIAEFWNRWHITLSNILKDYLFYPLSLAFKRSARLRHYKQLGTFAPPVLTFLVAGIWHGFAINFILYGLCHGLGLAFVAAIKQSPKNRNPWIVFWRTSPLARALSMTLNFAFVSFSFVLFSLSKTQLLILWERLF